MNNPVDLPEFSLAWRGYDRVEVDDYVAELRRHVADAHTRALQAEHTLHQTRPTALPGADKIGDATYYRLRAEALRAAAAEAEELRTAAHTEAELIIWRAESEAARLREDTTTHRPAPDCDSTQARPEDIAMAEELMTRCRRHSEDEAAALLARAREESEQILHAARGEADRIRAALRSYRDQLRAELTELEQRRTTAGQPAGGTTASRPAGLRPLTTPQRAS